MMKLNRRLFAFLSLGAFALLSACSEQRHVEKSFRKILREPWQMVVDDSLTHYDSGKWHLDGLRGRISCDSLGLTLRAGEVIDCDSDHVVLWNRTRVSGPVRVEYDFTRLDTSRVNSVNIIYLLAQGSGEGEYRSDIMSWNELRTVPAMKVYFNHMRSYHISYAVTDRNSDGTLGDYIRGRQYDPAAGRGLKGTELMPEYKDTHLFKPGITYHMTFIVYGGRCYMEVCGDGRRALFWFRIDTSKALHEGYVGLRQMWGRTSRYAGFKVWTLDEVQ